MKQVSQIEAAQRQLDWAIRLFLAGEESASTHTLAHASYCLLSDLRNRNPSMNVLKKLSDQSAKSVHLTIALAITLWKESGQQETPAMREFSKLPDALKKRP